MLNTPPEPNSDRSQEKEATAYDRAVGQLKEIEFCWNLDDEFFRKRGQR
jgi:hypothetical protein